MTMPRTIPSCHFNRMMMNNAHHPFSSCGTPGESASGNLPDGVFAEAIRHDCAFDMELAALGKQNGSIFHPNHMIYKWMRF